MTLNNTIATLSGHQILWLVWAVFCCTVIIGGFVWMWWKT